MNSPLLAVKTKKSKSDDRVDAIRYGLELFNNLKVELPERYKTCGRCTHQEDDPDIVGSTCYLCKRNSTDHRIDWFEEDGKEEPDGTV